MMCIEEAAKQKFILWRSFATRQNDDEEYRRVGMETFE
jgi:hypothetical protein